MLTPPATPGPTVLLVATRAVPAYLLVPVPSALAGRWRTPMAATDTAYRNAAAGQRSFAAAATSGGEGAARMAEADRIDAKRHR